MKKIKLVLMILMMSSFAFGQNKDDAEKLVNEGIENTTTKVSIMRQLLNMIKH